MRSQPIRPLAVTVLTSLLSTAGLAGMAMPAGAAGEGAGVTVDQDVVYREVGGEELALDVYLPAGDSDDRPAVVLIHGGGWRVGNKANFAQEGRQLAEAGYVAVSVNYRLAPDHPYPAAVDDVQAAVKWLRKQPQVREYGIDPDRIGALGGSAGGHLAGMLAVLGKGDIDRGSRVAAAVAWSGPMDLRPAAAIVAGGGDPPGRRSVPVFLGCTPGDCPEERAAEASPVTHVDESDAPLLLFNSTDELVAVEVVQPMADALDEAGVEHDLVLFPGNRHARGFATDAWPGTLAFFEDHLTKAGERT